ncbi:hypothetical protein SKAU_G00206480 [Synaphobranchus kaupii]|uniref:Secreted protein n=1 Tax=Synaphobranchus kaupii TaxID=118154 RepID=A0A9Q1FGK0_SYNKA|nr:hypothetical protein SKAU_G00206480 [Synaphobranchus kaupii]
MPLQAWGSVFSLHLGFLWDFSSVLQYFSTCLRCLHAPHCDYSARPLLALRSHCLPALPSAPFCFLQGPKACTCPSQAAFHTCC